jgi:hypothetical protein
MKLTQDALNRALLARQGLLTPLDGSVGGFPVGSLVDVVERIGAIQAQYWPAVAVSLFARTRGYTLADVYDAFERRDLVVGSSIRGTVHAVSAHEYPIYAAVAELTGVDTIRATEAHADAGLLALRAAVLDFCADEPRDGKQIADFAQSWADAHPGELSPENLAYHVEHGWRPIYRSNALIRFPDQPGKWSSGAGPKNYLSAPRQDVDPDSALRLLVRRHLAAFGPAAADDVATWLGLRVPVARQVLKGFADLAEHTDEAGRPLFDLPDADLPANALPDPSVPAPPRLLPKFDSPLLAYTAKHRRRIVADEHKGQVYLKALQVAATFLIDGYVAGTWSTELKKKLATVTLVPFGGLRKGDRAALTEEAERVLRLQAPDSVSYAVEIAA